MRSSQNCAAVALKMLKTEYKRKQKVKQEVYESSQHRRDSK